MRNAFCCYTTCWIIKKAASDVQEASLLKKVSPIAWQHIDLYGRYEFRKGPETINMNEIVQELDQVPV